MNTVHISAALAEQHPRVFNEMMVAFEAANVSTNLIQGTSNIWVRDWMPIQTMLGRIEFVYGNETRRKYPILKINQAEIGEFIEGLLPFVLDGGNVVQNETHVLITEAVFRDNPSLERKTVMRFLEGLFGKQLVILPVEPGDTLGHADGIVAFAEGNTVLINDYTSEETAQMDAYQSHLSKLLEVVGLEVVPFPYAYYQCPHLTEKEFREKYPLADSRNEAAGYYLNFLALPKLVLLPVFGFEYDEDAIATAKKHFPGRTIVPIECFDLAMTGGLLHCTTWT
jgi:agmatine deiminase